MENIQIIIKQQKEKTLNKMKHWSQLCIKKDETKKKTEKEIEWIINWLNITEK